MINRIEIDAPPHGHSGGKVYEDDLVYVVSARGNRYGFNHTKLISVQFFGFNVYFSSETNEKEYNKALKFATERNTGELLKLSIAKISGEQFIEAFKNAMREGQVQGRRQFQNKMKWLISGSLCEWDENEVEEEINAVS